MEQPLDIPFWKWVFGSLVIEGAAILVIALIYTSVSWLEYRLSWLCRMIGAFFRASYAWGVLRNREANTGFALLKSKRSIKDILRW